MTGDGMELLLELARLAGLTGECLAADGSVVGACFSSGWAAYKGRCNLLQVRCNLFADRCNLL